MFRQPGMFALLQAVLSRLVVSSNGALITNDTFFYGQSPPVYPSPEMPGIGPWATAHEKAVAFVSQLSLEEKAGLTVGTNVTTGCSGQIMRIPRVDFPGLCLTDAGNGVRNTELVSSWPSGIHVGASWNKSLAYQRALGMGGEFKKKGVNVALGPVVGPLGRVAEGGRNWEGTSNDPYLAGQLVFETVKGIQDAGVIASTKHYILNEQETNRNPTLQNGTNATVASVSSNIDDKTMHELYLWPFAEAVRAGTGCVMCSYNRVNNSYGCQNSATLNGLLKTELGFEGFVVSDWTAQHAGIASADAGLDMAMPNSDGFWGAGGVNLTLAVNNGTLNESRVDDMATRIIAAWYQMGQDSDFPEPGIGMPIDFGASHKPVNAKDPEFKSVLLEGAIEGHVLVKNENALPLKAPQILSLFGYDATSPPTMNPLGANELAGNTSPWTLGLESLNFPLDNFLQLLVQLFNGGNGTVPQIAQNGTMVMGGGSGANAPPYISSPFDAITYRAHRDGTSLFWDFISQDPFVDAASDACLVFINAFSTEGVDRVNLLDDYSDSLVNNVANQCSDTIVIIHNAGIRLVDQFIDHPNVTALIFGHLPGQDSGYALADILYGDVSPSGKLPYTVAHKSSDYHPLAPTLPEGEFTVFPQDNFTEGVYIDYRAFDKHNTSVRYPFGFGLTYSTFDFSDLNVATVSNASQSFLPPESDVVQGGLASLQDVLVRVSSKIANIGSVKAAEVAQLYVGIPGGPVRQLRGFEKKTIEPGESVVINFNLTRRDLSIWGVKEQSWVLQEGTYHVYIGDSSRDLPLRSKFSVKN